MAAFDAARPTWYIIFHDANYLYEWAMSQAMPIGRVEWKTAAEAREIDWLGQMKTRQGLLHCSEDSLPWGTARSLE